MPVPEGLAEALVDYELGECIGRGGMGIVFRARQKKLGRTVAIKVLTADRRDPSLAARFEREARALAGLAHPGIVAVHDFGDAAGHLWIAMEHVDGVDLRRLEQERMTPAQSLDVVQQVCAALQYAHDLGVVHRDIKPENILVDRAGRVKITDFGLAKLLRGDGGAAADAARTRSTQVMGTPQYMAPEQMERPTEVDHRADLFALGVVLYELLCGELPVGRFAAPSQRATVDPRLDEVVLRALERDRDRRYQTAAELGSDVERIRTGAPAAPGRARRATTDPSIAVRPLFAAVLAAAAIAVVLLAVFAWRGREFDPGTLVRFLPGYRGCRVEPTAQLRELLEADWKRRPDAASVESPASAFERSLQSTFVDYQHVEIASTTVRIDDDGVVHAVVAPFAERRERWVARLAEPIGRAFGDPGSAVAARLARAVADAVMPCGVAECRFTLAAVTPGMITGTDADADADAVAKATASSPDDETPAERRADGVIGPWGVDAAARRLWSLTLVPRVSCLPVVESLARTLGPSAVAGATVEPAWFDVGAELVSAELELVGNDSTPMPAVVESLRQGVRREPWYASPGWSKVDESDDGRRARVALTNIGRRIERPRRMLGADLPPRGEDPSVTVARSLAQRFGGNALRARHWTPIEGKNHLDATWHFEPQGDVPVLGFAEIAAFLRSLEEQAPMSIVVACTLRRVAPGEDRWRLEKFSFNAPRQR